MITGNVHAISDAPLGGAQVQLRHARAAGDADHNVPVQVALGGQDRRKQGLVLDHSVRDNLLLPLLSGLSRGPLINDRSQRGRTPP